MENMEKEITINKKDFIKATADTANDEKLEALLQGVPALVLVLALYSSMITERLFDKTTDKEESKDE